MVAQFAKPFTTKVALRLPSGRLRCTKEALETRETALLSGAARLLSFGRKKTTISSYLPEDFMAANPLVSSQISQEPAP